MAKPTIAHFGDDTPPVEDSAAATMAPPERYGGPSSPGLDGEHSGKTGANDRVRVPPQVTYGDTFPQKIDVPSDYRITPPEMHSHGPRGVEMDTNAGKGRQKVPPQRKMGETFAEEPYEANRDSPSDFREGSKA